jgi:uncharacterized protein (TIGR02722 family)
MTHRTIILGLSTVLAFGVMTGCEPNQKVEREDPETVIDLTGRWNDVDSRQVAEQMVADSLDFPWYRDFERDMGRRPVIAVGPVQNRTPDYIDTQLFTKDIEREFIRGGDVRVVAMPEERQPLIDEVLNQQEVASVETAKRLKQMLGADFFLMGRIGAIIQRSPDGKRRIRYFKTDLEVINLETSEKVWIGTKEIKKDVTRAGYKP